MGLFGKANDAYDEMGKADTPDQIKAIEEHQKKMAEESKSQYAALSAAVEEKNSAAYEEARRFAPKVVVRKYETGSFLCHDKLELPIRYIESIEVTRPGRKFFVDSSPSFSFSGVCQLNHYESGGYGSIGITMMSGQKHDITCSFALVDATLDALRTAWKTGKPVEKVQS